MGGSLVCTPKPCDGNPTGAEGGDNYDPNVQDCTGKFDGSGCDASCYPGYMPSGEAHYTCANAGGRKGRWTDGSLKCTPVTCEQAKPQGPGAVKVLHSAQCAQSTYSRQDPPTCEATCVTGYNDNTDEFHTCESRHPLSCPRI